MITKKEFIAICAGNLAAKPVAVTAIARNEIMLNFADKSSQFLCGFKNPETRDKNMATFCRWIDEFNELNPVAQPELIETRKFDKPSDVFSVPAEMADKLEPGAHTVMLNSSRRSGNGKSFELNLMASNGKFVTVKQKINKFGNGKSCRALITRAVKNQIKWRNLDDSKLNPYSLGLNKKSFIRETVEAIYGSLLYEMHLDLVSIKLYGSILKGWSHLENKKIKDYMDTELGQREKLKAIDILDNQSLSNPGYYEDMVSCEFDELCGG